VRQTTKEIALNLSGLVGRAIRITQWPGLTIFLFHNISDHPSEYERRFNLATPFEIFQRQIDWICREYEVIHPDDVGVKTLPGRSALLTFDDGFRGVLELALPLLESRQAPATLFLNLGVAAGEPNAAAASTFVADSKSGSEREVTTNQSAMHRYSPERLSASLEELTSDERDRLSMFEGTYANWRDLSAWDRNPLFRFGNHLWNHFFGPAVSADEFATLYSRNDEKLREFASYIAWFAFTNGRYDTKTLATVNRLGPKRSFTGIPRRNPTLTALLDRFDLNQSHSTDVKLEGALTLGSLRNLPTRR
jgi:peptidoglycan/xylan/chitin deacetylase (PgdA/CDA1 family)